MWKAIGDKSVVAVTINCPKNSLLKAKTNAQLMSIGFFIS